MDGIGIPRVIYKQVGNFCSTSSLSIHFRKASSSSNQVNVCLLVSFSLVFVALFLVGFLFLSILFVVDGGVLVLLIFGYQIVHVGLGFSEFHLVHTLSSVPMEEGLSSKHSSELLADSLEELLDGSGVTQESNAHLQSLGRNIADGGLDVVGDPFHKVRGVLVLDVQHLFVYFLGGHSSSKHSRGGQVSSVAGIRSSHHVLGIEHLLGQLGDSQRAVALRSSGGQWGKSYQEEMQTREGDQVDGQLSQI